VFQYIFKNNPEDTYREYSTSY